MQDVYDKEARYEAMRARYDEARAMRAQRHMRKYDKRAARVQRAHAACSAQI